MAPLVPSGAGSHAGQSMADRRDPPPHDNEALFEPDSAQTTPETGRPEPSQAAARRRWTQPDKINNLPASRVPAHRPDLQRHAPTLPPSRPARESR